MTIEEKSKQYIKVRYNYNDYIEPEYINKVSNMYCKAKMEQVIDVDKISSIPQKFITATKICIDEGICKRYGFYLSPSDDFMIITKKELNGK